MHDSAALIARSEYLACGIGQWEYMVALAAVLVLAAFQTSASQEGLKALDQRQYQNAVDAFTKAIAADPADFSSHFNLDFAYSMLGNDKLAIDEYKKTLELKPGLYQAELNLGIILLRDKQASDAVPHLAAAADQKPKEFRPNYYLAEALRQQGALAKSEDAYNTALQIDPKSAAGELGLAQALAKDQKLDEAAPHFRKAADLDPKYRDGLLELAALYENAKRPDEAIALYQQFPEEPAAEERLGSLLLQAGRYADAAANFEEAVKKSPTTANRAALAEAYIKNKQPDKAMPIVEQALAADANNYDLVMLHGRMIRDERKFPQAAQAFFRATQIKPDSAEAWSELAGVLVLVENYPAALAALDRIAALHAEKPGHVYLRAITLDKVKQYKPALQSYQRFLAMDGGKNPDEEFKARQRIRIIQNELSKR